MDFGLQGKSALVMASSSGLGKAIALELAREGAHVMLFSSSEEKLVCAQQEISFETGNRPLYYVGNILDPNAIQSAVSETEKQFGPIYALVNNTGGPKPGAFDAFDDNAWQQAYELCLLSYIRSIRAVLPGMRANGGGRIVNSTSSSVRAALDNLILSNTFRMGVMGLTKTLACELGPDNIMVNVIGPGRIATERLAFMDSVRAQKRSVTVADIQRETFAKIPVGRYGQPEEYARLAAFLCSAANTYITGQTVLADGGMVHAY